MYRDVVSQIKNLPWNTYDPKKIIFCSLYSALEFAESLKCALEVFPENQELLKMASGEIQTDNLVFDDYNKSGDHWQFLDHFCQDQKSRIFTEIHWTNLSKYCETYYTAVSNMPKKQRAMTIFSREQELPTIFNEILKSHDWESLRLGFFKYYLERHIELDSAEGGHGELTKDFELEDNLLLTFYTARLAMYKGLQD